MWLLSKKTTFTYNSINRVKVGKILTGYKVKNKAEWGVSILAFSLDWGFQFHSGRGILIDIRELLNLQMCFTGYIDINYCPYKVRLFFRGREYLNFPK